MELLGESSNSAANTTQCESTGEEEQLTKKKKRRKKSKETDINVGKEIESNLDHSGNGLEILESKVENELDITEEANGKKIEDSVLNEIHDPSEINLFNNTFFEDIDKSNNIENIEEEDIKIVDQTESIYSDDVIVVDDKSDSEIEFIETIHGTEENKFLQSSNLNLANCKSVFTSSFAENYNLGSNNERIDYLNFDVKVIQSKQSGNYYNLFNAFVEVIKLL